MERFQGEGTHVVSHAWNPGGVASEIYRGEGSGGGACRSGG